MNKKAIHTKSDWYLANKLTDNHTSSFDSKMQEGTSNALDLLLQNKMQHHYSKTQRMNLALTLETLGSQYTEAQLEYLLQPQNPTNHRKMWLIVSGLLLVGLLAIYLINRPTSNRPTASAESSVIPITQQVKSTKSDLIPASDPIPEILPVATEVEKEKKEEKEDNGGQPPVVDYVPPKSVKKTKERAAKPTTNSKKMSNPNDFVPNSYLDPLVNTSVKNDGYNFKLIRPITKYRFKTGRMTPIIVEGFLESEKTPNKNDFSIHLFTNKESDFESNNSIVVSSLIFRPLEDEPQNYTFDYHAKIDLKPGLYYYILTKKDEDDPIVTGKVIIGSPND